MSEEYILRAILLCFFINYLFMYFKAKKEVHIIKVPNYISLLFGAPIGIGAMPEFTLLYSLANMISFIVGVVCYFVIGKRVGGTIYTYTWIGLTLITVIYDAIKYKD